MSSHTLPALLDSHFPFRPLTMTSELLKHAPQSRCARDGVVRHSLTGHSFLRSFPGERL